MTGFLIFVFTKYFLKNKFKQTLSVISIIIYSLAEIWRSVFVSKSKWISRLILQEK